MKGDINWRIYFKVPSDIVLNPKTKETIGKRLVGMVEAPTKEEAEIRASKGNWRNRCIPDEVQLPKEPVYRAEI
jgi:hypothetical protein